MNLTKKIWHDENSEPPKNYLWAKRGKLFKYVNGQWKEISKNSSNNSGVDLSNFINAVESLSNLDMHVETIMPFDIAIDEIGEENLSKIEKVYGDQGDYVVLFAPSDQTEEDNIAVAYLTEEERNELMRRRSWHFDSHLFSGGWVEVFDPDISNYSGSIPVSKELPLWGYSEDHEYTLDDLSGGQYIVAPMLLENSGNIGSYLINAESNGYNVSFFLHSNYSSLDDGNHVLIAVKIHNETETYYFPAVISVNTGPM